MLLPELEIRVRLSRYLAGNLSLDEFEEWFIPETWDIEQEGIGGTRLATEIRSALFRLSAGEMSEGEFRSLAKRKVTRIPRIGRAGRLFHGLARTARRVRPRENRQSEQSEREREPVH